LYIYVYIYIYIGWGQQAQVDYLYLRPVTQGKDSVLLDKLLPHLAAQRPAPCAVLARDVRVAVGYWHRDGMESKARLDALIAAAARKVVVDLVVACIKDHLAAPSASPADAPATCSFADAPATCSLSTSNDPKAWLMEVEAEAAAASAQPAGGQGGQSLTVKAMRGEEGVTRVEKVVSDGVWARAGRRQDVQVVSMMQEGRLERYMVVEEPELLADIARQRAEKALREARHAEWVRQQQPPLGQEAARQRATLQTLDAGLGMMSERVLFQLQQIQQLCTLQQQLQQQPSTQHLLQAALWQLATAGPASSLSSSAAARENP
jgi:hypothetical protein